MFMGAYGGLRIGELAGLRSSRVDLPAGAVTVAETLTEGKGKLIAGPPRTRAGRRTVGLPPFIVRELEAHLAARAAARQPRLYRPRWGAAAGSELPGALWVPATKAAGLQACVSTTFATRQWRCGSPSARRPRRPPCGRGTPRSASPWTATATRRSPGRSRRAGAIQ
jgi:integrase